MGGSDLAEAHILLGEPHITAWFEKNGSYGAPIEEACRTGRASPRACQLHEERTAAAEAAAKRHEEIRAAWESAFRAAAIPPQFTVNVPVYEGGRLQTKTMDLNRYGQVYGTR